jgi:hypothetical protein
MLQDIANRFHSDLCGRPDPRPELVQEARASASKGAVIGKAADGTMGRPTGAELAQRAIEQAKADGVDSRSALGAQPVLQPGPPLAPFKVLNAPPAPDRSDQPAKAPDAAPPVGKSGLKAGADKAPPQRTALMATPPPVKQAPPADASPPATMKCRVWTASYGGQKAIIIRSVADQMVNFTVLDVNEGSEAREAEAFIAAYAKNGKIAGEYPSQSLALEKAFEFCPEG